MQRQPSTWKWGIGLLLLGCGALVACAPEKVYVYIPVATDAMPSGELTSPDSNERQGDVASAPEAIVDIAVPDVVKEDDGPSISCTPDGWYCIDSLTSAKCNAAGDGHAEYWNCTLGQVCTEFEGKCKEVICTPGDKKCASNNAYTVCRPDGTGYLPPVLCGDDQLCNGAGTCVLASCIGTVLFLVDVSGSMATHWQEVRASVASLEGNNPFARFGLWAFPAKGTICGTNPSPAVPISDTAMADILTWFDSYQPYGQTPLVDAYKAVVASAGSLFEGQGGAVVVLSDGADTCAYPEIVDSAAQSAKKIDELSQSATALFAQHDVSTYVIGYNYTGDPAQLNALAANGGTDASEFTEAGDEAELANALVNVLEDIKVCLGP